MGGAGREGGHGCRPFHRIDADLRQASAGRRLAERIIGIRGDQVGVVEQDQLRAKMTGGFDKPLVHSLRADSPRGDEGRPARLVAVAEAEDEMAGACKPLSQLVLRIEPTSLQPFALEVADLEYTEWLHATDCSGRRMFLAATLQVNCMFRIE